jgi:ankyrin repeat protein
MLRTFNLISRTSASQPIVESELKLIQNFHQAISQGDCVKVKEMLSGTPGLLNSPDRNGNTPVHLALLHLLGPPDPPSADEAGDSRMNEDRLAIAHVLLDRHPNLNLQNNDHDTPLHLALKTGCNVVIIEKLLERADLSIPDRDGNTALHVAFGMAYKLAQAK